MAVASIATASSKGDTTNCTLKISYDVNGENCNESNGLISVWIGNGCPPYNVLVDGELFINTKNIVVPISDLSKGNYRIMVVDSKGCETQSIVALYRYECEENSPPEIESLGEQVRQKVKKAKYSSPSFSAEPSTTNVNREKELSNYIRPNRNTRKRNLKIRLSKPTVPNPLVPIKRTFRKIKFFFKDRNNPYRKCPWE